MPSIGISEILKLNQKFTDSNAYIILASSLDGRSLYYASLDSNYKIIEDKLLFIGNKDILGERVRDFIYIEELNKIVLFLKKVLQLVFYHLIYKIEKKFSFKFVGLNF